MPTDNHDLEETASAGRQRQDPTLRQEVHGYETTDVNVSGVVVFLAGLFGFVFIFFIFCFFMGRVINVSFSSRTDRHQVADASPARLPAIAATSAKTCKQPGDGPAGAAAG